MLMYDYIITYSFEKDGCLTPCTGATQISRKKKIKTFNDVNQIITDITKRNDGAKNLFISNIILLGRNWH